jgi:hypothetical protein
VKRSGGSGKGTVDYEVEKYKGDATRSGSITVAGQTLTITQEGAD